MSYSSLHNYTGTIYLRRKAKMEICENSKKKKRIISISQLLWFIWKQRSKKDLRTNSQLAVKKWQQQCLKWLCCTVGTTTCSRVFCSQRSNEFHSRYFQRGSEHTWKNKQCFGKTPKLHLYVYLCRFPEFSAVAFVRNHCVWNWGWKQNEEKKVSFLFPVLSSGILYWC